MNPVEVLVNLFSSMMLGMLLGKQISDIFRDKWTFRGRGVISIVKGYYTENEIRGIVFLLVGCFWAYLWYLNGTAISSVTVFILAALVPISSCIFHKGHSDVEVSQEIEENKCNIGRCSAMSFFINYLDRILDELPASLETYDLKVNDNPREKETVPMSQDAVPFDEEDSTKPIKVLRKLFILIPKSGNNQYAKLSDVDDKLEDMDIIEGKMADIRGHKGREYKNTVYRIKQKNFNNYHFLAEFATPLTAIFHVQKLSKKSGKRTTSNQVELFYNSLIELLGSNKQKYGEIYCPLLYDDTSDENNSNLISNLLYQELIKEKYI